MSVSLVLWSGSNWTGGFFSPLKEEKKNSAGDKFFSSLKGWLSCSVLICFPVPSVIFKLPFLTCHSLVQRETLGHWQQNFTLLLCPQLLPVASDTTLRSTATTCAGESRHPSTQQGPSTHEKQCAWDGVSALTLDFLAETHLCVVRLESFTGKSLNYSIFFNMFSAIYLKNKKPKQRKSRNSDRWEECSDKIIIQPSVKEQHLHH